MIKNSAPASTSKIDKGGSKSDINLSDPRGAFIGAVLTMSWQLAIVVLIPVVGGFELDRHFKTLPIITIIGFVIAVAGVVMVLKRMLNELNQSFLNPGVKK